MPAISSRAWRAQLQFSLFESALGPMDWTYSLCGFVVGALVGVTGMGGGSVMTALLILVFGVHPMTAVGTDLLYAAVTKATGTRVHAARGNVVWSVVGLLAAGSVPAAVLTIWLLSHMPVKSPALAHFITMTLGATILLASFALLSRLRLSHVQTGPVDCNTAPRSRPLLTVALGAVLGVVVTLTSVGAGAIGIVLLRALHPEVPSVRLVGSDIAHAVPLTLLAGIGHWLMGDIDWVMLASLLAGSLPGIVLASQVAHRIPERVLQPILGVMLFGIGVSLIRS